MADRRILPAPRPKLGRNRRAVDDLARRLRHVDAFDEVAAARVVAARDTADELDRLRDDPEHSGFTVAAVMREHRALIGELAAHLEGGDSLADLLAQLDAADDRNAPQS